MGQCLLPPTLPTVFQKVLAVFQEKYCNIAEIIIELQNIKPVAYVNFVCAYTTCLVGYEK